MLGHFDLATTTATAIQFILISLAHDLFLKTLFRFINNNKNLF